MEVTTWKCLPPGSIVRKSSTTPRWAQKATLAMTSCVPWLSPANRLPTSVEMGCQ